MSPRHEISRPSAKKLLDDACVVAAFGDFFFVAFGDFFFVSVSVSTACLSRQRSPIRMLEEIHDIVTTKRCNREEHLGRTRAQPLRRCTTKNHLEAKDVEAEDVDDVAAWPLAKADADVLGDVEGREGPEADRALVAQAAEDGVLLEADVVAEPPRDVDDVAAWPLAEADADAQGHVEGHEGPEADRALVSQPPRTGSSSKRMSLANRGAMSTTSRLGRSPRRTRTCSGTSKAAKGRRPIERSWRRPPRTGSSSKRMSLANRGATSTTTRLGGSRRG